MNKKTLLKMLQICVVFLFSTATGLAVGPCQLSLDGDFNHDCIVDMDDLAMFASAWLTDWSGQPGAFLPSGIFVAPPEWGGINGAGCGSILSPCQTITYGMLRAVNTGSYYVFVADGMYQEMVSVQAGINLLGGFNPATWVRSDPEQSNTIIVGQVSGSHTKTLVANSIVSPTEISGFVIQGADAATGGGNSYAVWIKDSNANLVLEQNQILAGYGASGADGTDGTDGQYGVDGTGASGVPDTSYDAFVTTSSPCSLSNNRQYKNGGELVYGGDDISGGHGGGNQCAPVQNNRYSGINGIVGQSGAGASGGAGGAAGYAGYDGGISGSTCYVPSYPMVGENGSDGTDGASGTAGAGASNNQGAIVSNEWIGVSGTSGSSGGNGGGGGGGGAGGGSRAIATPFQDRLGAHGGGGGSGGGGGTGGTGGNAGGGSFSIFILNTIAGSNRPTVQENIIIPGRGGNGGNGGFGGKGCLGGNGGAGGSCPGSCLCHAGAGDGGQGGDGGCGGGGGGGAGGVSYGIYTWNVTGGPNYHLTNIFTGTATGGTGGKGGKSIENDGTSGTAGAAANYIYH